MDTMNNHTHKMARACLGFESGVGDFRGNVTVRPWNRQQAGWLRNIGFFPKH